MANNRKDELVPRKGDTLLQKQNYFVQKLSETFTNIGETMNENQKRVGMNSIIAINDLAQRYDKDIYDLNPANVYAVLQRAIGNELDPNNDEIAFIPQWTTQRVKNEKGNVTQEKVFGIDTRRTAKGDMAIVRRRATGIDTRNPFAIQYTVYEGDDFTDITFNGAEVTPPQYTPRRKSKKVIHVVWGLNMLDGTVRWIVGSREDAKASIIAQAVNNGAKFEETQKMWDLSVDEIFETYTNKTLAKDAWEYGKKVVRQVPYFNDTWRANQNRESMMETKIRGYMAARMVDISFNNVIERQAFDDLIIEDKYIENQIDVRGNATDLINENTNTQDADFEEKVKIDPRSSEEVPSFDNGDTGEVIENTEVVVENDNNDDVEEETTDNDNNDGVDDKEEVPNDIFSAFGV